MQDYYRKDYSDYSAPELVRMLGSRFKEYRLLANKTQKEVAEMAGVTPLTVYRFETGAGKNISLGNFLLLLKAIGCINDINEVLPEQPESPYLYKDNIEKNTTYPYIKNKADERVSESYAMGKGGWTACMA